MILSGNGRYLVTNLDESTFWRYDRRWRRTQLYQLESGGKFEVVEGNGALLVVEHKDDRIDVAVHPAERPDAIVAKGAFADGSWTFDGDAQAWAGVPEYILVPRDEKGRSLLRVADGATLDTLEEVGSASSVAAVPDSRLVVLAEGAGVIVYDPKTHATAFPFRLAIENDTPALRFRADGAELWIDDVDTLLKLETKGWSVIDAAGSHAEGDDEEVAKIDRWGFSARPEHAVVCSRDAKNVFVIDVNTMESIASMSCETHPVDATVVGKTLFVVDESGKALRTNLDLSTPPPEVSESPET